MKDYTATKTNGTTAEFGSMHEAKHFSLESGQGGHLRDNITGQLYKVTGNRFSGFYNLRKIKG